MSREIIKLRKQIDEIDNQILKHIERRAELSVQVGKVRGNSNRDKAREMSIVTRLLAIKSSNVLDDSAIAAIWRCIIEYSRKAQARSVDTIKS